MKLPVIVHIASHVHVIADESDGLPESYALSCYRCAELVNFVLSYLVNEEQP